MEYSQELFDKVASILTGYKGFIEKGRYLKFADAEDCQVIFVRNAMETSQSTKINLYKNNKSDTGFASFIVIKNNGKTLNLLNVHGKSRPGHKFDTPARLKQSQKIIDFMKAKIGAKIIGGDFNLELNTKSVAMFGKAGYKNLIKEFDIKSTRNEVSWKEYSEEPGFIKQHFADYCFVSPNVKVQKFEVPYNEISDHLPLILEFEI